MYSPPRCAAPGLRGCGGKAVNVDRGVDDIRVATVAPRNRRGDVLRVRNEPVDARACATVPRAKARERAFDQWAAPRRASCRAIRIGRGHRPREARRRMAVADMDLRSVRDRSLGDRVRVRHHDIVSGEIEAFDDLRAQHRGVTEPALGRGQGLQRRSDGACGGKPRAVRRRQIVDERVQIGAGEHLQQLREHGLAAAPGIKPVVDECDPHRQRASKESTRAATSTGSMSCMQRLSAHAANSMPS